MFKTLEFGLWAGEPGTNLLDTGAPFYNTYKTADGKYIAVGALEDKFYQQLIRGTNFCQYLMHIHEKLVHRVTLTNILAELGSAEDMKPTRIKKHSTSYH